MKKIITFICILALTLSCFTGCGKRDENHIIVGASSTPHAEILEFIKSDYEALGYTLEIVIYTDYIMPNTSLAIGDLDANYFQHLPYLEDFNAQNGTKLVSAGAIHVEPMGLYGGKQADLGALTK